MHAPKSSRRSPAVALALIGALLIGLLGACSGSSGDDKAADTTAKNNGGAPGQPEGCDGSVESPDTRFIVDACGRVVILRGVNVESSSKGEKQSDDHFPKSGIDGQATLARWGWNTVRFLVFWGAMEPEKDKFDEKYLDEVQKWLDWYQEHDIHVVLDMHQDLYSWSVGFDGAPDWAVDTKGVEPGKLADGMPWYLQGTDPAVQNAYQSFWNPEPGQADLKAEYMDAIAKLADRFADHPAVIGYDVMNEPAFANGDLTATLAIQGQAEKGEFKNENLTKFMQAGIDAVREHDQDAWVMIEPTSLLNAFPYPGDLIFEDLKDPRNGPPRLSYAGHLYQQQVHDGAGYPENDPYLQKWEKYRSAEVKRMDGALWIGEWGGPDQDRMDAYVSELLQMTDRLMIGWAYWSWDPGGWSPVEEDGTTTSANGKRLMRVQPRAVAGTPTNFAWDADTDSFTMDWDERTDAKGATEIAVPSALFPKGIEVILDGEKIDADWDEDTSVLTVEADRDAKSHKICIQPTGAKACS
ncbi:MAG: cellulase family glycosylhydrolase [Acidimicrobiales bacterium]|nr:cellulase family glycosylhydrolase [Acidimicrobiales bacterium]